MSELLLVCREAQTMEQSMLLLLTIMIFLGGLLWFFYYFQDTEIFLK